MTFLEVDIWLIRCIFLFFPAWRTSARPLRGAVQPGRRQRPAQPDSLPHQPAHGDQRDDVEHALQPVPRVQGGKYKIGGVTGPFWLK